MKRRSLLGLLCFIVITFFAACTPAKNPINSVLQDTIISLQNISCQSCGMRSVDILKVVDGVKRVSFNRDNAELSVRYDSTLTNPEALVAIVRERGGFDAVLGAGKGSYTPNVEFPKGLDVLFISKEGEDVDIQQYLVPGKVTVFDFYAEWCGPCKDVDREMLSILYDNDDVALRKLNAEDWDSPLAKRYLANVPALPYVIVYSKRGKLVAAISGLKLDKLRGAIEKARND